jgi:hypothetical protein
MRTFSRPTRGAPNDLAGEGDAGVVIGEHGDFERQADDIHDAQSLQKVQPATQALDARGIWVDQAFASYTHSRGKRGALHQPADRVLPNDGMNVSRSAGVGIVRDARIAPSSSTIPARI